MGSSRALNALMMAFMILSSEKRSVFPSRLVMVKLVVSIVLLIILFTYIFLSKKLCVKETGRWEKI